MLLALRLLRQGILIVTAMAAATATAGTRGENEDPEEGQSWLQSVSVRQTGEGRLTHGTLRATDDFGVTRDRRFHIIASGDMAHRDRKVLVSRFEPECIRLAELALMTPGQFCDRLTLTYQDRDLLLEFRSYDANRRFAFTLVADPLAPGSWSSREQDGIASPSLALSVAAGPGTTRYNVDLRSEGGRYTQKGEVSSEQLRESDLSALELSMVAVGDVLRSFNAHEFVLDDLPRDDAAHEPTPYSIWGERLVEGGCIGWLCFGELGGGGGGGGAGTGNADVCDGLDVDDIACPWDLTYAIWPITQRIKIWKISDDEVGFSFFVRNNGPGPWTRTQFPVVRAPVWFATLFAVGASAPLMRYKDTILYPWPYDGVCFDARDVREYATGNPMGGGFSVSLSKGASMPAGLPFRTIVCPASSGRPPGRYRLYVEIDPNGKLDHWAYPHNNIGDSGLFDWVHLRNN